jgi:hypothetical protein
MTKLKYLLVFLGIIVTVPTLMVLLIAWLDYLTKVLHP